MTSGGTVNVQCVNASIAYPGGSPAQNTMGACQLSDRMDGGFGYRTGQGALVSCDYDGNELYSHSTFYGVDNITPYANGLWKRTMGQMSASEISSAGISQPTFDISIFGYTAS